MESKSSAQASIRFELYSGAGNRFLLTEAPLDPAQASELARAYCRQPLFEGHPADGLLLLRERREASARMLIFNADGTRPEACGNGLRCVGWHLARTAAGSEFRIETDAGQRSTRLEKTRADSATIFADMGPVSVSALELPWPELPDLESAYRVSVGNPHCVLHVHDERRLACSVIAEWLQTHSSFPSGVNVGFLARRAGRWHLRVIERGVGETSACGTGACAAAATIAAASDHELEIKMGGGVLRVHLDAAGRAGLSGDATFHGSVKLDSQQGAPDPWATCSRS